MRAFTQWMLNAGEDYFYYRRLRIGNALDRSIQSAVRYEDSSREGYCTAVIRFTDETNKPLSGIQVQSWLTVMRKRPNATRVVPMHRGKLVLIYRLLKSRTVNGPLRLRLRMIFTITIRHFMYPYWETGRKSLL